MNDESRKLNPATVDPDLSEAGNPVLLWLAIAAVGAVFFVSEHDFEVSLRDNFALEADQLEEASLGGNALRRAAFIGLALLGTVYLVLPSKRHLRVDGLLAGLMLFFVFWCGLSLLWSIDPSMSLRRFGVLACCLVAAFGFSRQLASRDLLILGLVVSTAYLVLGVRTELVLGTFRPFAGDYRFAGTVHPNTQGLSLAVLCLSAFFLARTAKRTKPLLIALFCVGFVFLVLTKSRASFAGVLLALTPLWILKTSPRMQAVVGIGGVWSVCAAGLVALMLGVDLEEKLTGAALLGRQEEAKSLTGRIPLWTELMPYVEGRLLTGYGYEAFWTADHIDAVSSQLQWGIQEAHSAYIDAVLSVGLIGAFAFLWAALLALSRAAGRYKATGDPAYGFLLGLLIFGFINSLTESGMLVPMFMTFVTGCGVARLAFWDEGRDLKVES